MSSSPSLNARETSPRPRSRSHFESPRRWHDQHLEASRVGPRLLADEGSARRNLAERAAALALLILAAPLLALLLLCVLVLDGRPVLYRGTRLGLRKRPFTMFKVRTLRRDAEHCTALRLLDPLDGLEIRGGRWLRETRLDELPQLWNIVAGEMSFIGPRPERPAIYHAQCRSIPGYDLRFGARPGLVGPSQLFTPHSSHKWIRARIDSAWSARRRRGWTALGLILYTPWAMGARAARHALRFARDDWRRLRSRARRPRERKLHRARPRSAVVVLAPGGDSASGVRARLVDLNAECLQIHSRQPLRRGTELDVRLEIALASRAGARRLRSATCQAVVVQQRPSGPGHATGHAVVLRFRPLTRRSHYVVHQYFLGDSLAASRTRSAAAPPPRVAAQRRSARAGRPRSPHRADLLPRERSSAEQDPHTR